MSDLETGKRGVREVSVGASALLGGWVGVVGVVLSAALMVTSQASGADDGATMSDYYFASEADKHAAIHGQDALMLSPDTSCERPGSCVVEAGTLLFVTGRPANMWITTYGAGASVCDAVGESLNVASPQARVSPDGRLPRAIVGVQALSETPGLSMVGFPKGAFVEGSYQEFRDEIRDHEFEAPLETIATERIRSAYPDGVHGRGWPSTASVRLDAYILFDIDDDGADEILFTIKDNVIVPLYSYRDYPVRIYISDTPFQGEHNEAVGRAIATSRLLEYSDVFDADILGDRQTSLIADELHFIDGAETRFFFFDGVAHQFDMRAGSPGLASALTGMVGSVSGRIPLTVPRVVVSRLVGDQALPDRRVECEFISRFAIWNALTPVTPWDFQGLIERLRSTQ